MSRRPALGLAARISLVGLAVAVVTALVAGLLSINLVRTVNEGSARRTLARLADATATTVERGVNPRAAQQRARRTLQAVRVQYAFVAADGSLTTSDRLAGQALTPAERQRVLDGASLSLRRTVLGARVLVEARPAGGGGVILVQRRADALAATDAVLRRILLALIIAAALAVVLGLLVAYRIAAPLRRTADAARALAAGRRNVTVAPGGPVEVAEVGAAVNTLAATLSHSEARQREFLMSVSHELRTPLTAITGYAEALADSVIAAADVPAAGAVLQRESRRLERLVADLLDLARLDADEFRVDITAVDAGSVVRDAAAVWSARCQAAGVVFRLDVRGGADLVVATDAGRLRQVLDGLLENALRVTPAGAPIVVALRREPVAVVVEVRDGGPGLREEDLAVAFERSVLYERYRGVRQVGTGLGLAIVHGLVRRLSAGIEAGHAPEGGARFTVWLPTNPGSPTNA